MRLSQLYVPTSARSSAAGSPRPRPWLTLPLTLVLLSTGWLLRPTLTLGTPSTHSASSRPTSLHQEHQHVQLLHHETSPDHNDATAEAATASTVGEGPLPARPEPPYHLANVLMLHINLGWAQFYDVQTPPRRLDRFPYYEPTTRIGGMKTAQASTQRLGQLFAAGWTGRILPLNPYQLSADISAHFMTIIPHGPWLNHQPQFSPASSIHEFALSTTVAQRRSIQAMHIKYGLLSRLESTSFNNFITGHRRRALLVGGMLTAGTLARARLQLRATASIASSFRFYTVESSRSFKLSTSELPYHNFELHLAKYLLDQFVGEVGLIWRPSDVTVANINEYTHHGFPISSTSSAAEPTSHKLTITQLTLGITKVF